VASLLVVLFRDTQGDGGGQIGLSGSPTDNLPVATTDAPDRLIAWANDIYGDGAFKVVVGDTTGAAPSKVMPGPFFEDMSHERSPVWSPDGSMLALVTDRDGNDEIYAVSGRRPGAMPSQQPSALETTGPRNITNDPGSDSDPNWSPDSRRIAFSSRRYDNFDIYVTQIGSPEATRLTTSPGSDSEPAWSPDGTRIAYRSERIDGTGAYDIVVMNADGSEPRRVSTGDGVSSSPSWSPDGKRLAYTTLIYTRTDGVLDSVQVNVVDLQTGESQTLVDDADPGTENAAFAMLGADGVNWSPDGALIAFTRPVDDQYDIAIASPNGSGITMLTSTPDRDEVAPRWSPESLQLLYVSLPHGPTIETTPPAEIHLIDRNGTNDRQITPPLTVAAALASRPSWGPLVSEAGKAIPDPATPEISNAPTATPALDDAVTPSRDSEAR
jgi:Tol biopolymer transport system component